MERNNRANQAEPTSSRAPVSALHLAVPSTSNAPDPNLALEPRLSGQPIKQVLFVDRSQELQRTIQELLRPMAQVNVCSTFEDACSRLLSSPPDLLVTSVRLQAHNGLHLVYLAARTPRTRCIVHLTPPDYPLAREVEEAGAFLVREPWLTVSLKSLVTASLPQSDRRNPDDVDRRSMRRGGRRCTDASQIEVARRSVPVRALRAGESRNLLAPIFHH